MKPQIKEKAMNFIYIAIVLSVIMLHPSVIRAEAYLASPDSPQVIAETQAKGVEPSGSANIVDTDVPVRESIIAQAGKDAAEAPDTAAVGQDESEIVSEEGQAEAPQIADPLAPVNNIMFQFNDKLYFWGIKPAAQVYSHIVPEEFRFAIANVYDNLWAPSRILNNLFQLRLKAAGNELIRFVFNSFAGIGGMGDMAKEALGIKKQDADFGQTLGHYGIGHGLYLVLPVFGPSSVRDGIGLVADQYMHPLTYVKTRNLTFGEKVGIFAHEKVNDTSFKIGDYESFKEAAIDPYVSMRDAFVQNRQKFVEESMK